MGFRWQNQLDVPIESRVGDGQGGDKENAQAPSLGTGGKGRGFHRVKENKRLITSEGKI